MRHTASVALGSAVVVTMGLSSLLAQQESRDAVALRQAITTDVVDGETQTAIEMYRRLAASSDPGIAADARRRLAQAQARQGVAGAGQTALRTEQVLTEASFNGAFSRVSPSGRYAIRMVQGEGGGPVLGLHDLSTGTVRKVVEPVAGERAFFFGGAMSPDEQQIAYEWHVVPRGASLRVVSTAEGTSSTPRTLYENPDVSSILPLDWSADGRLISVVMRRRDHTSQIGVVTVADQSLRILETVDWTGVGGLRFSPDSKWLAFHRREAEGRSGRDVFLMAVDGATKRTVLSGPSDDTVLEWTADGRLLAASDRSDSNGVWAVTFRDGASPSLSLLNTQLGEAVSLGLTKAGTLYYRQPMVAADFWVAGFDASARRLTAAPTQPVTRFRGFNIEPEWSPDGRELAFFSIRGIPPFDARIVVTIQSLETGAVRELFPEISYLLIPRWSPDGRQLIAAGLDLQGREGVFAVDVTTGRARLAAVPDTCVTHPYWAADGKSFFCVDGQERHTVEVDAQSGQVKRGFPGTAQGAAASPDGRHIVYGLIPGQPRSLKLLSLADGTSRELIQFATPESGPANILSVLTWTADSKAVIYAGRAGAENAVWLLPIDGDQQPRRVQVPAGQLHALRINPRTGRVVYAAGSSRPAINVWKMENFLTPRP